jgi:hypothetical protein
VLEPVGAKEADMRRRRVAVLLAGLGLSLATGAGAQTTTSSTTSPSTSTSTSTTSPTIANPCTGRVCTAEPPAAFLAGSRGEVALDRGSYCWQTFTPGGFGLCADRAASEPNARLVVTSGETVTLRFSAMTPTEVVLVRANTSTPLTAGNPVRFVMSLPVGVHTVGFFTRWVQGDASYGVRLDVRAASTGRIALTG